MPPGQWVVQLLPPRHVDLQGLPVSGQASVQVAPRLQVQTAAPLHEPPGMPPLVPLVPLSPVLPLVPLSPLVPPSPVPPLVPVPSVKS